MELRAKSLTSSSKRWVKESCVSSVRQAGVSISHGRRRILGLVVWASLQSWMEVIEQYAS